MRRCLVVLLSLLMQVLLSVLHSPIARAAEADATHITFSDDFTGVMTRMPDGTQRLFPDRRKWAFTFWPGSVWPTSYGTGTNWLDGKNAESQVYTSPFLATIKRRTLPIALRYNPFHFQDDGLHIRASLLSPLQQELYQVGGHRRFGSGLLRSLYTFQYGKVRLVAKLPSQRGTWPAFWLLSKARPWPPEIDVFEGMAWGQHHQQIHLGIVTREGETGRFGYWTDLGVDPSQGFHEYGLDWDENKLSILFDGRVIGEAPTPPSMKQPMYLLINLAVGGTWPYNELGVHPIDSTDPERLARGADLIQNDFPADMVVRSVRIEQMKEGE